MTADIKETAFAGEREMGNRSWLYLQDDDPDSGYAPAPIAEANNNFPTLWKILLAQGNAGDAIRAQRVFGDADTPNLTSNALQALERVHRLSACLTHHPLYRTLPELARQFEGLERYLAGCIEKAAATDPQRLCFSANLDELSWLGTEPPARFIERMGAECDACWHQVEAVLDTPADPALLAVLEVPAFDDWRSWAWSFGFGCLSHSYFDWQDPPRAESFTEYLDTEAMHLADDFWRVKGADGRWGVCVEEKGVRKVLVEPVWDDIGWDPCDPEDCLVWVGRGDRIGLLKIDGEKIHVLLEPQLDTAYDFEWVRDASGEHPVRVVKVEIGGRHGLLRDDGSWLFEARADSIGDFTSGYAAVCVDGRCGFIDTSGHWVVEPQYEAAQAIASCGLAIVRKQGSWGAVTLAGAWGIEPAWDEMVWHEDTERFIVTRNGRKGLLDPQGREIIEPVYPDLRAVQFAEAGPRGEGVMMVNGSYRFVAQREDKSIGLFDSDGRLLMPFDYQRVDSIYPAYDLPDRAPTSVVGAVKVGRKQGRRWLYGVYDTVRGRQLLPCRYRQLHLMAWNGRRYWLLVEPQASSGRELVGVAHEDGAWLHAPRYEWIGMQVSNENGAMEFLAHEMSRIWSENDAIEAVRDTGEEARLFGDGRAESAG